MHRYDYSFLKDTIPGNIVGLTNIIADLQSREEFGKKEKVNLSKEERNNIKKAIEALKKSLGGE
jgi:ribosomal protein S2